MATRTGAWCGESSECRQEERGKYFEEAESRQYNNGAQEQKEEESVGALWDEENMESVVSSATMMN